MQSGSPSAVRRPSVEPSMPAATATPSAPSAAVFERLLQRKVLVKNVGKMHALLDNCLRVTVSTPAENALFLDALKSSLNT